MAHAVTESEVCPTEMGVKRHFQRESMGQPLLELLIDRANNGVYILRVYNYHNKHAMLYYIREQHPL